MNLHVNEIKLEEDKVVIYTEEPQIEAEATGTLVVDSDHFQFVYLLDGEDSFHNLRFVEESWKMLKANKHKPWFLYGTIELTGFETELNDLLDNIKGNYNYGKPFTERVEEVFEL
ncbi:hypothetical protein [Macrococcoides caseolyticum]|uniref:UPF0738 family protein n=1 Tax=Macrococcoides caseolyticum TaxID=69966 RepID=UPI001F3851F6|nr:hypothetical protein [Macrococcus caseolyticus]MCE4955722.1 hypothetical protein [Macrococcus caseolyticus]